MILKFTIYGNEFGNDDNPLPKLKMTGKQHWLHKAQKYVRYKQHVVAQMTDAHPNIKVNGKKKLLNTTEDVRGVMDIQIYWKNRKHGDPENIFGAIADAIFDDDKYLDGSFKSQMSKDGHAKVDVVITLNN